MRSREIALITVFAALWMAAEISLGPLIGRLRVGPLSLHGVVNRVVGWMLMLIMAEVTMRFGRASAMSLIAATGTRIIRLDPLEGFVVGAGYALGGLVFDILFFTKPGMSLRGTWRRLYLLSSSAVSGALANAPYLLWRLYVLGFYGFLILSPTYITSTVKGILFSIIGTTLGLSVLPSIRKAIPVESHLHLKPR